MRYELYIDGQLVDLGSDDIALNYKSNVLSEIKKITSNNSYTIKLPKTQRNISVINHADIVSSSTQFPYLSHNGRLLRDGIEIINNARVVLLSSSQDIEIALVWNDTEGFNRIIEADETLRELPIGSAEGVDYVTWELNPTNSAMFPNIDWGLKSGELYAAPHPCVSANYILDKITEKYGISFDFPYNRQGFVNSLVVPLVSRNSEPTFELKALRFSADLSSAGYLDLDVIDYTPTMTIEEEYGEMSELPNKYGFVAGTDYDNASIRVVFSLTDSSTTRDYSATRLVMETYNRSTGQARTLYNNLVTVSSGTINGDIVISEDLSSDDILMVGFRNLPDGASLSGEVSVVVSVPIIGDIQIGNLFPFVKNLPDIKISEFLQSIASMGGMYAYPNLEGNITFMDFDRLERSKAIAYDWSDKLITQEGVYPQSMGYTIDGMSQKNWFRYKEDSTDAYNADDYIPINNVTLQKEGDIVSLPFAASDDNKIPSYSYNGEGELEFTEVEPRIMFLYQYNTEGVTTYQANFESLEWSNVLSLNYGSYRQLVTDAKVIKEYVKLSGVDLKNINFSTPVYLRQYGAYFAILTIKTKEEEISEVELIKM